MFCVTNESQTDTRQGQSNQKMWNNCKPNIGISYWCSSAGYDSSCSSSRRHIPLQLWTNVVSLGHIGQPFTDQRHISCHAVCIKCQSILMYLGSVVICIVSNSVLFISCDYWISRKAKTSYRDVIIGYRCISNLFFRFAIRSSGLIFSFWNFVLSSFRVHSIWFCFISIYFSYHWSSRYW